jgi:nucleoside-diphosphate-sugar epimerase
MQTVSILGCGWLGGALSRTLAPSYDVRCLGRDLHADAYAGGYACDTLVIGIPPREGHLKTIRIALDLIDPTTQVILLSSTAFYEDKPAIVHAEERLRSLRPDGVILRLGGLMGYDRIAGRYTAGTTLPYDTMSRYIHRDDAVGIIAKIIEHDIRSVTWDALAPIQHPKSALFAHNARRFGFEPTRFEKHTLEERIPVNPHALIEALEYRFVYPDVMGFW